MSDPVARLNAALEGRYAIERELGEGGMGTQPVWAHDGREILYISESAPFPWVVATVRTEPDFTVESRQDLPFSSSEYGYAPPHPEWDLSPDDQRVLAIGAPPGRPGAESRYVIVQNFFEELRQRVGN